MIPPFLSLLFIIGNVKTLNTTLTMIVYYDNGYIIIIFIIIIIYDNEQINVFKWNIKNNDCFICTKIIVTQ